MILYHLCFFVLVTDVHSTVLRKGKETILEGLGGNDDQLSILNLQYIDDTFLFSYPSML